jgi:putative FmdB family regulatory protein
MTVPTYEYRCASCEHQFERFQRMSDEPVKECEVCGEPVKRLLFPVAIHFKGNGFYSTDYAKKNALGTPGASTVNGGSSDVASDSSSVSSAPDSESNAGSGEKPGVKSAAPAKTPAVSAAKSD